MRIFVALLVGAPLACNSHAPIASSAPVPSATASAVASPNVTAEQSAAAVRRRLLPKVHAGNATLAEAQTVKAACMQLRDIRCAKLASDYARKLKTADNR